MERSLRFRSNNDLTRMELAEKIVENQPTQDKKDKNKLKKWWEFWKK